MGYTEGRNSRPCPNLPQSIWKTEQTHRLATQQRCVSVIEHQQAHLGGISGQEYHPLHTVRRKDIIQGFRFGEDAGRKISRSKALIRKSARQENCSADGII